MFEKEAHEMVEAIKEIAKCEDSCDRLESYLACHFDKWLEKFASTPEGIVFELQSFGGECLPF